MRIFSIALLMFISVTVLVAEEKVNYSGKIIDFETKQPIELVAIYTNSASTISNTEGEYELKSEISENITFSDLNYHTQSFSPQNLPNVIELKPKILEWPEILVIPQDTIINELKGVWNNYNNLWNNYAKLLYEKEEERNSKSSYYYRQLTFNNDTCVEYIESFYTKPQTAKIRPNHLKEGRYARVQRDSVYLSPNYLSISRLNPLSFEKAKTQEINGLLCKDFEHYYNVSLNRIISPGQSDEIKVYEFQPKEKNMIKNSIFLSGLLFVRQVDQIIVRAELHSDSMGVFFIKDVSVLNENHKFVISYLTVPSSSLPMIASVKNNSSYQVEINGQIGNFNIQSTLVPVNLTFNKKRMSLKNFFMGNTSQYNPIFWDENTIVKRTKIEQQVLDDFNREGYFDELLLYYY